MFGRWAKGDDASPDTERRHHLLVMAVEPNRPVKSITLRDSASTPVGYSQTRPISAVAPTSGEVFGRFDIA